MGGETFHPVLQYTGQDTGATRGPFCTGFVSVPSTGLKQSPSFMDVLSEFWG